MALVNCRTCGQAISAEATFCPYCGQPVAAPKQKTLRWGVVLVAAVVVIALLVSVGNSLDREPERNTYQDDYSYTPNTPKTGSEKALEKALSYLRMGGFSKNDLIDQLEYENFSSSEITYAINNCGADWKQQALIKAKSYLRVGGFSEESLTDQLEHHEFTSAEVSYAIQNCGANWNQQAVIKAKSYMKTFPDWTKSKLIDQLEYEGFTYSEARYGADNCGSF